MFEEEVQNDESAVVSEPSESSQANCANCDDSGKECYVCGAGRQLVK